MKLVKIDCPKCKATFFYKNYWVWVLQTPFHYFNKRKTKCPHCGEWSWVRGIK